MNTKFGIATLAVALAAAPSLAAESAAPDSAWDAVFTRTSGWTGGDVAGTVNLGDGRLLWLFGDSWIGEVADGRHANGSRMVNNTIAIQSRAGKSSEPPAKSALQFYWHGGANDPSAWMAPKLAPAAAGETKSDSKNSNGWFWPTGGGAVVPGPDGRLRLLVFLFHIGKRLGKEGIWAFKSLGGTMATVDNLADPVEKWVVEQDDIPFAVGSDAVANAAKKNSRPKEINWGVAALRYRPAPDAGQEWLYIYGIRNEAPLNRQVILARAKIDSPARFDEWRFYAGNDRWSAKIDDLVPIAEHVTNELSVERLPGARQSTWVMVHSEPPLGRKIFVRTAANPEGPWSNPKAVYSAPEVDRNPTYFAYAAKGHFDLSRPDELLITYVVNAHDFGAMVKDAGIYRPRFIRVPLKAFVPPGP